MNSKCIFLDVIRDAPADIFYCRAFKKVCIYRCGLCFDFSSASKCCSYFMRIEDADAFLIRWISSMLSDVPL